jgi:DNA repair exonuclease SbcCD ATPase subunit
VHALAEKKKSILQQKMDFSAAYTKILAEKNGCETVLRTLEEEEKRMAVLLSKAKDGELIEKEIIIAAQDVALAQSSLERFGALPSAEEMDLLRVRSVKLDKALEMLNVKDEMLLVDKQLVENELSLHVLAPAREEFNQIHSRFSSISSETDACLREMQLVSSMVRELVERVESAEKLSVQKDQLTQRLAHAQNVEEVLGVFSHSLVVTQQQLREGVIEAINAALQELWSSVYPYEDFTLAKVLIQDNDYVLTVKEKMGNWISAESSLSGGERSAAALALRMAIAFVLTRQLSWIILDEPTHNLDVKSVQSLSVMLKERLPALVDQVFVITHSAEIEKAATGSLYVMQREKNEDGITIPLNKLIDAGTKII